MTGKTNTQTDPRIAWSIDKRATLFKVTLRDEFVDFLKHDEHKNKTFSNFSWMFSNLLLFPSGLPSLFFVKKK